MYTANMTPDEIDRETNADVRNVLAKIEAMSNAFRRKVLKANKFPVTMRFEQHSVRKNRWIISLVAESKKDVNEMMFRDFYCICESPNGKFVYRLLKHPTLFKYNTIVLKPHFFSRYRERMGLEETGEELIKKVMDRMNYVIEEKYTREDGGMDYVLSFEDGVGLGDVIKDNKVSLVRTFVPKRMLFNDQLPEFQDYEASLEYVRNEGIEVDELVGERERVLRFMQKNYMRSITQ